MTSFESSVVIWDRDAFSFNLRTNYPTDPVVVDTFAKKKKAPHIPHHSCNKHIHGTSGIYRNTNNGQS